MRATCIDWICALGITVLLASAPLIAQRGWPTRYPLATSATPDARYLAVGSTEPLAIHSLERWKVWLTSPGVGDARIVATGVEQAGTIDVYRLNGEVIVRVSANGTTWHYDITDCTPEDPCLSMRPLGVREWR